jgi:hypothetical protein
MSLHRRPSFVALLGFTFAASVFATGCASGDATTNGDELDASAGDAFADGGGGDGTLDGGGDGPRDSAGESAIDASGDSEGGAGKDASDATATDATDGATEGGGDAAAETASDTADAASLDTAPLDTAMPDTAVADTAPPDPCVAGLTCADDADGDSIPDAVEGRCTVVDTDADGTPDYRDLDSDGDGVTDRLEWAAGGCDPTTPLNDADGDGVPNFRDLDSDANGLLDATEICPPAAVLTALGKSACSAATGYDFDGDGVMDFLDNDNDHDSPSSALEVGLEDKNELVNDAGVYVGLGIDTDGDAIPDVYDVDSDGDTIFDLTDSLADTDGDGVRNFRDRDSDADRVPDACEARGKSAPVPADLPLAVKDTDLDGKPDYLDGDSDSDLLADGNEDKNFNCIVDACESSRVLKDTDSDGTDDFIEATLDPGGGACWASDPTKDPHKGGKFYFIEPYSADGSALPTPTSSPLGLKTDLQKGDLGFVVDTTFSMNGEFTGLKTTLPTIIDSLKTRLPDLGIGIAGHDDFPTAKYQRCFAPAYACPTGFTCYRYGFVGNEWCTPNANDFGSCDNVTPAPIFGSGLAASDDAYYQLTAVTTDKATATTAVNGLRMAEGDDLPEDQVVALNYAFTGNAFSWPALNGCGGGSRPAVAETTTNFGALGFRKGALPMLMEISDAEFHDGVHASATMPGAAPAWCIYNPGAATCTTGAYSQTEAYPFTAASISGLATAMKAKGARFLGGAADDSRAARDPSTGIVYTSGPSAGVAGTSAARNVNWSFGAYGDMAYLADQTSSLVPPSAFTHGASCAVGQCCTGFNGAGVVPDGPGGTCRLVFNVNHDGTGLGAQVVDGVVALLNAITFDVHVQAAPTVGEAYDAVDTFMSAVQPSPSGGTDPSAGAACITFTNPLADRYHTPKAVAGGGDINETILGVAPGPLYCFNVLPKANTVVLQTSSVQVFHASLQVIAENGSGTIPLGTPREVLFIVPPIVN